MNRLLEKMSWALRRHNLSFSPLLIEWSGRDSSFEFALFRIIYNLNTYYLFQIHLVLPNKTNTQRIYFYSWDFLFLYNYFTKLYEELANKELWNKKSMTSTDKFILKLLDRAL